MNNKQLNIITEIMMERRIYSKASLNDLQDYFRTIEAINMLDRHQSMIEGTLISEYEIIPVFKCFILPSKVEYKRSDDARDLLVREPELTEGKVVTATQFKNIGTKIFNDFKVNNKVYESISRQFALYNDVETRHIVEGNVIEHKCIPLTLDFSGVYEDFAYNYDADEAFERFISDLITNLLPRER